MGIIKVSKLFFVFLFGYAFLGNGNSTLKFFGKQFLIRQLGIILGDFYRAVIFQHQIFDMLGVAFAAKNQTDGDSSPSRRSFLSRYHRYRRICPSYSGLNLPNLRSMATSRCNIR